MADTYLSLRLHLVWATKNRRPWLDPEWRPRLFACADQIIARKGGKLLCAGGVRDHGGFAVLDGASHNRDVAG